MQPKKVEKKVVRCTEDSYASVLVYNIGYNFWRSNIEIIEIASFSDNPEVFWRCYATFCLSQCHSLYYAAESKRIFV